MKVESAVFNGSGELQVLDGDLGAGQPQLVLYFGARSLLEDASAYRALKARYGDAHIVGCSTSGEILGNQVHDDTVVASAIEFARTGVRVSSVMSAECASAFEAGSVLGRALADDELRGVLVVSDGINVNGSELVRGLTHTVGPGIPITGGLAGDADRFEVTPVGCDGPPEPGRIAAVGFYGPAVTIGHGSVGGWDPFGPERRITRSRGNVLYELDGSPALDLYTRYLGDEAANLPGSALLFPLMVRAPGSDEIGLVRTVLSVDDEEKSMTFAGDLPQGCTAQLMRANFERLIDGAGEAARIADAGNGSVQLAVLISCVGRKMVLGQRTSEEVEAVSRLLGDHVSKIGYYSYGEISPHVTLGTCELHNQTMTVTLLGEQ